MDGIESIKQENKRNKDLYEFQKELSSLTFLDPACGSGNFLTETYLSLRRLENEILQTINKGQMMLDTSDIIKVNINQFYGIEINDFAVTVAKTALWIAESQMVKKTEEIVKLNIEFLPLKNITNIYEGNALEVDWNDILPSSKCNYIMGNHPFIGASNMNKRQKDELFTIFNNIERAGDLDYVTCWYKIASDYILNTEIRCAFVSTNSICQGEQPSILWRYLFSKNIKINFAYRTFRWDSEASLKAHVHCVIIGFSYIDNLNKTIYDNGKILIAKNINGYLIDGKNMFIDSFSKPLSNVEKMIRGSSPCDNGNYSFSQEEKDEFIRRNPDLSKFIKEYIGAREFINRIPRYCIWLYGANPSEFKNNNDLRIRIQNVIDFRKSSKKEITRELANTPLEWEANRYNGKDYILIPRVSSQNRKYIPIGFIDGKVIANDSVQLIPNASIYEFGILTSNVHNAWTRIIAGRLKSDFRYSNLVYNSFIWPKPSKEQRERIEQTAKMILEARKLYPNSSLADLYDDVYMPKELRTAHQLNDKAVMDAYGFNVKMTESECVSKLMEMYQELVNKE